MAAPNEPPRRVSMSYILGFSNKPFKDPKPPPPAHRPRRPSGLDGVLSTPGGFLEWAASDGRKGKLTGPGKTRSHGGKSGKASSEKGDKVTGAEEKKEVTSKEDTSKESGDAAAEDENPHKFTPEEDNQMLEWKAASGNKPWSTLAEEIGKTANQCKECFKQIKSKDENKDAHKGDASGKDGGAGGQQQQQLGGQQGGHQQQQTMTKKEKKALRNQNQGPNQNQGEGHYQNNKKKEEASGSNTNIGANDTSGDDGLFGILGSPDDAQDDNKNSDEINNDTKVDDLWTTEIANNEPWAAGGWQDNTGTTSGANDTSWDTTGGSNNTSGNANKNEGGSKKGSSSNKSGNEWEANTANNADPLNVTWDTNNDKKSNGGGSKKGGDSNKDGEGWNNTGQGSGANSDSWGGFGGDNQAASKTDWGAPTGGGGNTDSAPGWDGGADENQKPASNTGNGWDPTATDGANDTNNAAWDTKPVQSTTLNNNDFDTTTARPTAPAAKSASKAASIHSHRSKHRTPLELEVRPDETFSADDLRLVARILQQDHQMVWNRVSWRFRDKTGRTVAPDVFENKITAQVEGTGSEKKK